MQHDGDDILPVVLGKLPAGGHGLLIETSKDHRGRRWAHVQETIEFHDQAVYDHRAEVDDSQLLRGWVQLTDHNAVLRPVLMSESETEMALAVEQLSALLGAELQLRTLLAWARQPLSTASYRGVSPPCLMSTAMYDAAGSAMADGGGAAERALPPPPRTRTRTPDAAARARGGGQRFSGDC